MRLCACICAFVWVNHTTHNSTIWIDFSMYVRVLRHYHSFSCCVSVHFPRTNFPKQTSCMFYSFVPQVSTKLTVLRLLCVYSSSSIHSEWQHVKIVYSLKKSFLDKTTINALRSFDSVALPSLAYNRHWSDCSIHLCQCLQLSIISFENLFWNFNSNSLSFCFFSYIFVILL